ncbi:hypothetical protein [Vibrio coralliilyticus]|uniref:Uncharacterized protein n=1 Tax=Vibrio coralliilyticus TaxID=190893 RepID=A0AAP6ZSW5_9VIBR|nr:hypothetical protein [Vibrio coralliilyticus]NOI32251.1 hypothetical protein [Vibrio coralliilyticus]NOJ25335.1 hypothetical protein [Vibrio coralliilyticus]
MLYQLYFECRSPYRYVAYFRARKPNELSDSYFSVEIAVAQREWGTPLSTGVIYSFEVCKIERPEIMKFYSLKARGYFETGENFVSTIGQLLVEFGVLQEGVPFQIKFMNYSFIGMNA